MPRKKSSKPKPSRKITVERIIFTDLDGTLLDHDTYSWKPAEPALKEAVKRKIPVIFCTSKTRAETERYRTRMRNSHPFIVENGGAIYLPKGYFKHPPPDAVRKGKYLEISLGTPYKEIRAAIKAMKSRGIKLTGFGDMSVLKLRKLTKLSLAEAHLARKREYDEPFILEDPKQESKLKELLKAKGLQLVKGGRFLHITGGTDKGMAIKILTSMYDQETGSPVVTAGIGDSPNNLPMLRAVHVPCLLKNPQGKYVSKSPGFIKIGGKGPEAWNSTMLKFIKEEF